MTKKDYLIGEQKISLICHAEENAIMHAARIGVSLKGSTAYVTWPPCTRCARSLIQAGIKEIVYPNPSKDSRKMGGRFQYFKLND